MHSPHPPPLRGRDRDSMTPESMIESSFGPSRTPTPPPHRIKKRSTSGQLIPQSPSPSPTPKSESCSGGRPVHRKRTMSKPTADPPITDFHIEIASVLKLLTSGTPSENVISGLLRIIHNHQEDTTQLPISVLSSLLTVIIKCADISLEWTVVVILVIASLVQISPNKLKSSLTLSHSIDSTSILDLGIATLLRYLPKTSDVFTSVRNASDCFIQTGLMSDDDLSFSSSQDDVISVSCAGIRFGTISSSALKGVCIKFFIKIAGRQQPKQENRYNSKLVGYRR